MIDIKEAISNLQITRPAKAGAFYIATTIITKAIALFASPIFTRLLTPEEYGVFSLYLSFSGILSVVVSLGITGGAMYKALGKFKDNEEELVSGVLSVLFSLSALLLVFTAVFRKFTSQITGLSLFFNIILITDVFLNCAENVIFAVFRYKYSYLKICIVNLLYALISNGGAIILIYLTPLAAEARIIASFSATIFLIFPLIKGFLKPKIYQEAIKYILRLSLPLLPSAVSMTLIAQSDKLILKYYYGTGELGKYSIAYSVGFLLTTLTAALYTALQPWIIRKLNYGKTDLAKALGEKIVLLTTLGLISFLLLAHEFFIAFAAPEYHEAEIAVYPLAVAGYFQFISNLVGINIVHAEKTYVISAFSIFSLLLNVILNFLLIPHFSYPVAAVTTALAYATIAFLEYSYLKLYRINSVMTKKAFTFLFLSALAIPIYLLSDFFLTRMLLLAAVLLIAVLPAISVSKMLLEKTKNRAILE